MKLDIWFESYDAPIGALWRTDDLSLLFVYDPLYLAQQGAVPISLELPLTEVPYRDKICRPFFQNLLPENDQIDQIVEREGVERSDIAGLLFYVGADCSGAISCVPQDSGPIKKPGLLTADYDPLDMETLIELVRRLAHSEPITGIVNDPSPIAGVQRKIALTLLPDGSFALPKQGVRVPTTHILKVPRDNEWRDVRLETAAANLALICDLDVVIPEPLKFGDHWGLLIERFDRHVDAHGYVRRIHQEDFAQALGLPPRMKYERYGEEGRKFDAAAIHTVLAQSSRPAEALETFLKATFFNLAIGNTDSHAKNFALLYDAGTVPRIAPLYDMLPIKLNSNYTHELAYKIGNAALIENITVEDIDIFFETFGVKRSAARRMASAIVTDILGNIDAASQDILLSNGLKDFDDLFGAQAEHLIDVLGLDISLRERDYFAPRGGGW